MLDPRYDKNNIRAAFGSLKKATVLSTFEPIVQDVHNYITCYATSCLT